MWKSKQNYELLKGANTLYAFTSYLNPISHLVSMGVPQGSNLGPIFFSVYINDVALAADDSLIHLYADDTIL